jgi:hypothetical protein
MLNYSKIKTKFKIFIRRLRNLYFVTKNQKEIVNKAQSKSIIVLKPVPPAPCSGAVDRYYHFIFDLIIPIYCLIKKDIPNVNFLILTNIGSFDKQLKEIFPKQIEKIDTNHSYSNLTEIKLVGMNPKCVLISRKILTNLKRDICKQFKIKSNKTPNKILLIERLPPSEYFFTRSGKKGGGTSWRSILNHSELFDTISSIVKSPFEFHNIQLENIPFDEQVTLFDQAVVVIAQHGAALTNCLWMRKETFVIELGYHNSQDHFYTISKLCRLNYFWYKTNADHATIDVENFTQWLLRKPNLNKYFKEYSSQVKSNQTFNTVEIE